MSNDDFQSGVVAPNAVPDFSGATLNGTEAPESHHALIGYKQLFFSLLFAIVNGWIFARICTGKTWPCLFLFWLSAGCLLILARAVYKTWAAGSIRGIILFTLTLLMLAISFFFGFELSLSI
jgi:hypothetical protein